MLGVGRLCQVSTPKRAQAPPLRALIVATNPSLTANGRSAQAALTSAKSGSIDVASHGWMVGILVGESPKRPFPSGFTGVDSAFLKRRSEVRILSRVFAAGRVVAFMLFRRSLARGQ